VNMLRWRKCWQRMLLATAVAATIANAFFCVAILVPDLLLMPECLLLGSPMPKRVLVGRNGTTYASLDLSQGMLFTASEADVAAYRWPKLGLLWRRRANDVLPESGEVWVMTQDPSHRRLLVAGLQQLAVLDAATGRPVVRMSCWVDSSLYVPFCVAFGSGGRIAVGTPGGILIYDARSGRFQRLVKTRKAVLSLAAIPNSSFFVFGSWKELGVVNSDTGKVIWSMAPGQTHWTLALAVDPRGRYLASGGRDGTLRWWRIMTAASGPRLAEVWTRHTGVGWVTALAIDQRASRVAAAGHRKAVVFETQRGRRVGVMWWGNWQCESAQFGTGSRDIIVAAGSHGLLRYKLHD